MNHNERSADHVASDGELAGVGVNGDDQGHKAGHATSSRRGVLTLAGAAAAGAVASAAGVRHAAATNGGAVVSGNVNQATQQTVFKVGTAANTTAAPAIGTNGVVSIDASGSGSASTIGLEVFGRAAGIIARSEASNALLALAGTDSAVAWTIGGTYGLASGPTSKANLHLQPNNNFFAITPKTPVLSRTDSHLTGELENVDGELWTCVADGSPGQWRKLAGPTSAGTLHLLGTPKRVYDSRPAEAPLAIGPKVPLSPGASRTIDCTLNSSGVPAAARGVLLNVTIVGVTAVGYLAVTPGGAGFTGTSSLNWNSAGAAVANGVTVSCGTGATIDLTTGGGGTADVIVDVFGYFI